MSTLQKYGEQIQREEAERYERHYVEIDYKNKLYMSRRGAEKQLHDDERIRLTRARKERLCKECLFPIREGDLYIADKFCRLRNNIYGTKTWTHRWTHDVCLCCWRTIIP